MLRDTNQKETFMRRIPLLAGVIGLSLLAAPTFAAPAGPKRPNAAAKHKADPAKRDARRLAGLKAAGVDDARAQKALGTMKKFDAERKAVAESTRSSRQALKKLIQSKSSDENAYRTALSSLNAARKIGDDYLQKRAGRVPNPHTFTHGTSEQRSGWFAKGYKTGDINACDTFSARNL